MCICLRVFKTGRGRQICVGPTNYVSDGRYLANTIERSVLDGNAACRYHYCGTRGRRPIMVQWYRCRCSGSCGLTQPRHPTSRCPAGPKRHRRNSCPSFDTVMHSSECISSRLWQTSQNSVVRYFNLLDTDFLVVLVAFMLIFLCAFCV